MQSSVKQLIVAATAVVAVLLPVPVATAHAGSGGNPPAENTKVQYISGNPNAGMSISTVKRRIYLASGKYVWNILPEQDCTRDIRLRAGWYTWIDQLWPKNGYYKHYSFLDPEDPALSTASLRCKWDLVRDAPRWTWGSVLLAQF